MQKYRVSINFTTDTCNCFIEGVVIFTKKDVISQLAGSSLRQAAECNLLCGEVIDPI
ncbi:hypothetical protein ING2E5A_1483 [Petrimonas mucosa]|uniref:Uncharacterized protein n=1 Tax=Petrimonas mucosa TaxID=1642646 RepID=A0A1G4G6Y9_9BACT|nr:hypothetical protein ING2E5A_1483 [Petrimonas mucosa]